MFIFRNFLKLFERLIWTPFIYLLLYFHFLYP